MINRMKVAKKFVLAAGLVLTAALAGCQQQKGSQDQSQTVVVEQTQTSLETQAQTQKETETKKETEKETEKQTVQETQAKVKQTGTGRTIVIDPGHSGVVAAGTEPIGPGAQEEKAADASGTSGVVSGLAEYELTFDVACQLRDELASRGYTVLMTRESNDEPVSCIERALVANNAGADAMIRIHADGSESSEASGAMAICTTAASPFHPELYESSRRLSECVLGNFVMATQRPSRGILEEDNMSGNNWSEVPVTLIEMGFMTNPEEDSLMANPAYQEQMVLGMADGIDEYLGE